MEPRQDVVGVVVVVNGLMPALGTSVAPSGMIPPLSLVVPLVGFDNGDAVPWGATPVVTGAQLVAIRPPPSNVALPVDPIPAETAGAEQLGSPSTLRLEVLEVLEVLDMPEIPEVLEVPAMPEMPEPTELLEAVLLVVGLKPPGSIEVEPRGIPVGDPEGVEPTVPSGDVIPRPGVVNTLCAKLASQLSKTAAVTTIASRIETS